MTVTLHQDVPRRLAAEFLGTFGLLVLVVGSGIATSVDGAASTQLFQHAAAVGVGLVALIPVFGPVSGAHFNPAVTLAATLFGLLPRRLALPYVGAQVAGGVAGTMTANLVFGAPAVALGTVERSSVTLWASEVVATAGLVVVIFALVRSGRESAVPGAVGAWVAAAIFSTSSMCFANPAVTVARLFTDTWTAILPRHVPAYVLAQLVGTVAAVALVRWLWSPVDDSTPPAVRPAASPPPAARPTPARTSPPPGGLP